ncbi:uncharacterized protein DFL_009744 [Arthrobotrys flagrans]|uniref:CFEM domain-containing protein n=1 Tax=Arthrobotrys flagrans TaxID=97331 RepID=A0A436ZSI7_ARTFL|nr:hypothetical protein DFL_009744 [Arthrobotrys flagrans]
MRPFAGCVLVVLVSLLTAQAQDSVLPTCAQPCVSVGLGQTSCLQIDVKCLCQSSGYIDTVTTCVRNLCSESDRERAFDYSKDICSSVGIDVSIPGVSSTNTSSVVSATGAAEPTATNTDASSTSSAGSASRTQPPSSTTETSAAAGNQSGSGPTDTSTPARNNSGSSTPVGAIVGGVVALVAVIILGTWLLKREKRKKMEMQIAAGNLPPKPPMQPDPNSLRIWEGNNAYSWNPQTNVHDVQGGVPNAYSR